MKLFPDRKKKQKTTTTTTTVKPCVIDKTLKGERITLIENEKVVSDER